ncbi:EpsG family protein [Bacillus safensis]|uniref:EpsG family protein n=1 Tax=Bacillus safensis TaxID=561879 RepID=A0AC61ZVR6_BACIA|nr:EpsG family protein [Bacillus safensis]USD82291.1 EpsG family protein [Bacillus safensis]
MAVYLVNMIMVYLWSSFAAFYGRRDDTIQSGWRPNKLLVFFPFLFLCIVAGIRYKVGTDFVTYGQMYEFSINYERPWHIFGFGVDKAATDPGFTFILWMLNQLSHDPQIMYISVGAITYFFIIKTLIQYGRPFELSMLLFLGTFHYYASFNGMRQYMVAAILFYAIRLVINGQWKLYFPLVLVCSLFHSSALIMIPVYFIVRTKAWSWMMLVLCLIFLGLTAIYDRFVSVFVVMLQGSSYGHYEEWLTTNTNGMNVTKIGVLILPLLLAFFYRKRLRELTPESDYVVNFCLLGFLFGILATKDVIYARFHIYFGLYQLILLPYFTRIFDQRSNVFMYVGIAVCYILYSIMLMPFDSSVLPYRTIFNK